MFVTVKVIPKASRNLVKEEQGRLKVYCQAPADKGRANEAVLKLLAGHLGVKNRQLRIVKGEHSPLKVVAIEE